ncbi:unnamed protein product, partial [Tuber aestivum]
SVSSISFLISFVNLLKQSLPSRDFCTYVRISRSTVSDCSDIEKAVTGPSDPTISASGRLVTRIESDPISGIRRLSNRLRGIVEIYNRTRQTPIRRPFWKLANER